MIEVLWQSCIATVVVILSLFTVYYHAHDLLSPIKYSILVLYKYYKNNARTEQPR